MSTLGEAENNRVATFDLLYDRYHSAVYAYHLGRTNDTPTALDLLQETFLRVWRHIERAMALGPDQQRYWLFHIAKNVTIGYYRRQAYRDTHLDPTTTVEEAFTGSTSVRQFPGPSKAYEAKETLQELDAAIRDLPDELRLPLMMQVMGQMTSAEIGKVLGKPAGTIRYQISRARQQLMQHLALLQPMGGEGDA